MADELYDQPDLYDLVAAPDPAMERFYVDMAGGARRRVLELACGTGRLTLPLARSGANVTGGDLSAGMLDQARSRAAEAGLDIDLVELDMRDFALRRRFDRIIVPANSLLHLIRTEDLLGCLEAAGRHLEPDGLLVFDVFVPSARLLSLPPGERRTLGNFAHAELGMVHIEETMAYDPIAQINQADWYWSTSGRKDFRHTVLHMRQIYPQELPLLLERGGFRIIERFGGFDRSALTPASMRQVTVCALAG